MKNGLLGYLAVFVIGHGYYLYEMIEHGEPLSLVGAGAAALVLGALGIFYRAFQREAGALALLLKAVPVVVIGGFGYMYYDLFEHGEISAAVFALIFMLLVAPAAFFGYQAGFGAKGASGAKSGAA